MTTATVADAAGAARRAVADVIAGRALKAFYVAVLAVALVGSTQGVKGWIDWVTPAAFGAVLLAEVGSVALSIFADNRRQKGERALVARMLSAGVAGGAIAVQLRGHADPAGHITSVGVFFAGFSALGYVTYLLDSAAKRRDALRKAGKLAEPPPAYGAYQWVRHPWLTAHARRLAVANAEVRLVECITSAEQGGKSQPTTELLGRAASLALAAATIREEKRTAAIGSALRRRIAAGVDPTMAKIAVNTFDLSQVADRLAKSADYPALTGLLAAELTPTRIAAGVTAHRSRGWFRRKPTVQTAEIVAALTVSPEQETAETAPETDRAPALPVVPDGVPTLRIRCARSLPPARVATPIIPAPFARETVETAPETNPAPALAEVTQELPVVHSAATVPPAPERTAPPAPPALPAPETVETAPETDPVADDDVDQDDAANEPDDAPAPPPLPPIEPSLVPHLAKVMEAHRDWHLTISILGRHPDALTYRKIKAAAGITGQQLCADIRTALLDLRSNREAAEAYVGVNRPVAVNA